MLKSMEKIMDALDVETFFVCENEQEGRTLMLNMLKQFGFMDADVVFIQHIGLGARVRGRAYVHRPADEYQWLCTERKGEGENE